MGNSVPIHCIPPCALTLIESYCKELWVGILDEKSAASHGRIPLPPALTISWSRGTSFGRGPLRRANVVLLENSTTQDRIFTVQFSGQCLGVVTDNLGLPFWFRDLINGSLVLDWGDKAGVGIGFVVRPRDSIICASDCGSIVAVADHFILRKTTDHDRLVSLLACLDDWTTPMSLGSWTIRIPSRESDVLLAAHFTDLPGPGIFPKQAVCVFQNMDVVLMSPGVPPVTVGRLFGGDSAAAAGGGGGGDGVRVMAVECGSVMIRESADLFVFAMVATFPLGAEDFTFVARFSIRNSKLVLVNSWSSRTGFDSMGFVEHATNISCILSEIVTDPASPLIILRLHNTRTGTRIIMLDRRTLRILGSRVVGSLISGDHFAGVHYPITKIVRDPGPAVVSEGVRRLKEGRVRRVLFHS